MGARFEEQFAPVECGADTGSSRRLKILPSLSVADAAWSFSQGLTAIDKNSKFGYLNTGGQLVIPHQFPFFRQFF